MPPTNSLHTWLRLLRESKGYHLIPPAGKKAQAQVDFYLTLYDTHVPLVKVKTTFDRSCRLALSQHSEPKTIRKEIAVAASPTPCHPCYLGRQQPKSHLKSGTLNTSKRSSRKQVPARHLECSSLLALSAHTGNGMPFKTMAQCFW